MVQGLESVGADLFRGTYPVDLKKKFKLINYNLNLNFDYILLNQIYLL